MLSFVSPPPLSVGDVVRVVAPAGAFDRTLFFRGLGWLAQTFRVRYAASIFARSDYLAGSDERRANELNEAIACPEARAVIAARGGFGCTRISERVNFAALQRHPKWLVGFSDITALHLLVQQQGLQSLHAHNVTGLGPGDAQERERWRNTLLHPPKPQTFALNALYPGRAEGPLLGGNLTVLAALLGQSRMELPNGFVLFIEDVAEAPYRVDRVLTQLEHRGVFDRAAGVVSGHFTGCDAAGVRAEQVLARTAARLRLPWLHGLPVGHERPNLPLRLGGWVKLAGTTFSTHPKQR